MNEIQLFTDGEFNMRTAVVDGEPLFCLADVCKALDIQNPSKVAQRLDDDERTKLELGRQGETNFITESGLYAVILRSDKPNAKGFRRWVTSEVLPSIRKTGNYSAKPMTTEEKIKLLAQGNTELAERVDRVEDKIGSLENDMPLYGCEIDEVQKLVKRKVVSILGGKDSEAYADRSIRSQTFRDMYGQLKREFGCVSTYKSIKRRYIDNVREFIDGYSAPTALSEQISGANAQMNIGQYCDARR
ncbi:MAG: ORF6C domain-containing protein [Coprococcus sp.]